MGELDLDRMQPDSESTRLGKLDGLRVLWRPIGPSQASTHAATLRFRVGQADEQLAERGFSHLLERIVLDSMASASYNVAGSSGAVITSFATVGDSATIVQFVSQAAQTISDIATGEYPAEQIRNHARRARLEHSSRHTGVIGRLFSDLYGATRFGVMNFGEFGLEQIDVAHFRSWVQARFTRHNATLALHTSPPADLDVSGMLNGYPMPPVDVVPLFDGWPSCRLTSRSVGFVAPIDSREGVGPLVAILDHAVEAKLRSAGIQATVKTTFQPVSATAGMCLGIVKSEQSDRARVLGIALDELNRLAENGPTTDEIRLVSDSWFFHLKKTSDMAAAILASGAEDVLFGGSLRTDANIHTEMRWLSPERLAAHAQKIQSTLAVRAPNDFDWQHHRIKIHHDRNDSPLLKGKPIAPAANRFEPTSIGYLTMDTRAISLLSPNGQCVTIHAGQVEIMLEWADGTATVVSKTGDKITIVPGRWEDENLIKGRIRSWLAPYQVKQLGLRPGPPKAKSVPAPLTSLWWMQSAVGWFVIGAVVPMIAAVVGAESMRQPRFVAFMLLIHLTVGLAVGLKLRQRQRQLNEPITYQDANDGSGGPLLTGWLTDNNLLAPWVENGLQEPLHLYRIGRLSAEDLFRSLGGAITSDLCLPAAIPLLNRCHQPRGSEQETKMTQIVADTMNQFGRPDQIVDPLIQGEFDRRLRQLTDQNQGMFQSWAPELAAHLDKPHQKNNWTP